jgi:hypothetical protein
MAFNKNGSRLVFFPMDFFSLVVMQYGGEWKKGRKNGRKEGRTEGRKEGRKEKENVFKIEILLSSR